ncbi:dynein regulatory complex subunit 3 isoform X2 [Takifugu flavidus]|uniref:dynein regulatory complex subunit 3 isoform X2 n=1 Tax=Takifugu flavidus TaxID=433684 RepID=UPI00254488F5|nr:dynein regulatory complex subunit 3 isoform X2 [Takifugu flavidus]
MEINTNYKRDADKANVMDVENLLEEAMKELPDEQARKIANEDGLQYSDVHTLELDFRNIIRIDSYRDFKSLAKLYLNNNSIEKIEGLEYLINLKLLDLSSNNIKKIEGLENLRKLEMLLLAKNKISVIENMDTLEELTIFNIGHNCIEHRDNVFYLRRFKKLFTLCLFGNPAFQDDDYTSDITSQFPQLMYLDYKLCRDSTKNQGSGTYRYADDETWCEDLLDPNADEKAKQKKEAQLKLHMDAFVEFLNGSHLFDSMFGDDEAEMLQSEPEVAALFQTYKGQLSQFCNQLFELGLGEQKRREAEVNLFYSGQRQTLRDEQEEISDILTTFEEKHEKKIEELQNLSDAEELAIDIEDFNDEIKEVFNILIGREVELLSGLEDIMALFETNISDMVYTFVMVVQETFSQCRDLESSFYKKISENAQATPDNIGTDSLEVSEEAERLFTGGETLVKKLAVSHDNRLEKLKNREAQLIERLSAWKVDLLKEIKDKHIKQNHFRVTCIYAYIKHFKDQLEELQ